MAFMDATEALDIDAAECAGARYNRALASLHCDRRSQAVRDVDVCMKNCGHPPPTEEMRRQCRDLLLPLPRMHAEVLSLAFRFSKLVIEFFFFEKIIGIAK
jgi:hypothetical protein